MVLFIVRKIRKRETVNDGVGGDIVSSDRNSGTALLSMSK